MCGELEKVGADDILTPALKLRLKPEEENLHLYISHTCSLHPAQCSPLVYLDDLTPYIEVAKAFLGLIVSVNAVDTKMRLVSGADAADPVIMIGAWGGFRRRDFARIDFTSLINPLIS